VKKRMVNRLVPFSRFRSADVVDTTITYGDETSHSLIQDIDLGAIGPSSSLDSVVYLRSPIASTRIIDFSLQASLTKAVDELQRVEEVNYTVSVPVTDPLRFSSSVTYRHESKATGTDGVEGWATVISLLSVPGSRPLTVTNIKIQSNVSLVVIEILSHCILISWYRRKQFSTCKARWTRPAPKSFRKVTDYLPTPSSLQPVLTLQIGIRPPPSRSRADLLFAQIDALLPTSIRPMTPQPTWSSLGIRESSLSPWILPPRR
jgi:hypothetical protein